MPATPYLSIHEGAEVDAAVTDVSVLRGEMDRFTDFTLFTGGTAAALDSIVTTGLTVGARAFVINGSALYVFVLEAGTDAENSPTVVWPDDYAITTNEKVWKWQAITEAAEITGPGTSVDNGIARWNGTGGTAIQDSPITIDDTGFITVTGATARFLRSTNDNVVSIIGGDSKTNAAFVDFSGDTHATTPGRIGFTTKGTGTFRVVNTPITTLGGTEIFSIGADGSVTVSAKATAQVATYSVALADAVPYVVSFDKSRGTVALPTIITSGDCLGAVRFRGHSGAVGGYVTSAQIRADSTGTINNTTRLPSSLIFSTATDASPSVLTDRMTISNSGNVGIGLAPSERLDILGTGFDKVKITGGSGSGYVFTTSDVGSKAGALIVGTSGAVFDYDAGGFFGITSNTKAGIGNGSGTFRLTSTTAGFSVGLSPFPSANLDVNNSTTATKAYIYETTNHELLASPTNYARISITTTASSNSRIFTEAGGTGLSSGQPRILQVGTGPSVGTNIAGQSVIWHAGQGTGTGITGSHLFQTTQVGSSGAVANALYSTFTLANQTGTLAYQANDTSPFLLAFTKSRVSAGVDAAITSGDCLGAINFRGYSGAAGYVTAAQIRADSTGTIATTRVASSLIFATGTNAAPTVLTDAMFINNQQMVGIGGTPISKFTVFNPTDGSTAILLSGSTKGFRMGTSSTFAQLEGVDSTGTGSFELLVIGGASLRFTISSVAAATIDSNRNFSIGPSTNPGASLDINNSTTTTTLRLYHTKASDVANPTDYSRLTLSHTAAGAGKQTVNILAETGGTGEDNISIRLAPAGTGGLYLGPVADGTATGGNARGDYSTDLQWQRAAAGNVASGAYSSICGGVSNTASGLASAILGGQANTASANQTTAMGYNGLANRFGQVVQGAGAFATVGDAQTSVLLARATTTDGTANVELFLDGAGVTHRCIIATDTSWTFKILLTARRTDGDNETASYEFTGGIDNNSGTTALAGAVSKTVHNEDTVGWDADVVADNTFDSLKIQVTGAAANIRWVARIELVEVTG